MAFLKRGFKAVNEEKQRQEEEKKSRGKALWSFYLKDDGDEADVTFLTEEPINYYSHNIRSFVNGKERFSEVPCVGDNCKHCKNGEKTTFKSSWLVIDHREFEYKDKNGDKKTGQDQIRLFTYGTKIASQLNRLSSKYGIQNRTLTMVRMGKGTSTTYTFEKGDKVSLSTSEIEELLPEAIRGEYDGTEESLYNILENQILMLAGEDPSGTDDTEDDEDEDFDNTIISDDEDEEEEAPKKKSKVQGLSKKKKHIDNRVKKTSVKGLIKSKK